MSYIINNMTADSLIVIDEFGRSTSNQEAMALCWAVAEKIISSKAFTFFATHYQILCNLESLHSQVKKLEKSF
jgi:DNA mismatch repair protein MSH4